MSGSDYRLVFEHFEDETPAPAILYRVRLRMAPGERAVVVVRYYDNKEALNEFIGKMNALPYREILEISEYYLDKGPPY